MSLIKIKLGKSKAEGFGFKVNEKNGKLLVTQVMSNSIAFLSGLCCGDIIYSLNNEIVYESPNGFNQKIHQIKGKVQLFVHRTNKYNRSQHSYNNLSTTGSDPLSSNSCQKMKLSRSSIDLFNNDFLLCQVTDSNYVSENLIDDYLQPTSSLDNILDNNDPVQLTRKQAYKKPSNDASSYGGSPRFSVKRATKSMSIYGRDPNITIKRRLNNKPNESIIATIQRSRPDLIEEGVVLPLHQSIASMVSQRQLQDSDNAVSQDNDNLKSIQIEIGVKILLFRDKVKKPTWRKFIVENVALGVLFYCLDVDEVMVGCNSTAIDPSFSGLDFYMTSWPSNNSTSRFFLPLGQAPYNDEIDINNGTEYVRVQYRAYELDFHIDLVKLAEERRADLFTLLSLEWEATEDAKLAQTKTWRHNGSVENMKADRKHKTQRYMAESPRISLISSLVQTKLIEDVPLVIILCTNIIEKFAIKSEGIYRISGNESQKKKLENVVYNESVERWSGHEEWTNVNTVCSLLKSVLRRCPLIDRDTAIKLSMINLCNMGRDSQVQMYMDMVYHLRQRLCSQSSTRSHDQAVSAKDCTILERCCRDATFKFLLKHLNRVTRYEHHNKMGADNLSTCFWSTIIANIPYHDDEDGEPGDYLVSKKSDADRNLNQMVTFWITNADMVCALLEEEDEQTRHRTLVLFSSQRGDPIARSISTGMNHQEEAEVPLMVRRLIEYYASQAFIPLISHEAAPAPSRPDVRSRAKKTNDRLQRSSTSLSPRMVVRKLDSVAKTNSPLLIRSKIDNWIGRASTARKKDTALLIQKKTISLHSLHLSGTVKNVPLIVEVCITIINQFGLDVDGLYRISGKKHELSSMIDLVTGDDCDTWHQDPFIDLWANVYLVSGLLKSILKELCLIKKKTLRELCSQVSEKMNADDVRKVVLAAVYRLREDTADGDSEEVLRSATLRYVLHHLKGVCRHVINNRMSSTALAVCFMPVLMEDDDDVDVEGSGVEEAMAINAKGIQARYHSIMEKLIDHCHWIFKWVDSPSKDIKDQDILDSLKGYLCQYSMMEIGSKAARADDHAISQHMMDCAQIRPLLKRMVTRSNVTTRNISPQRRYSDSSKLSFRKSEL